MFLPLLPSLTLSSTAGPVRLQWPKLSLKTFGFPFVASLSLPLHPSFLCATRPSQPLLFVLLRRAMDTFAGQTLVETEPEPSRKTARIKRGVRSSYHWIRLFVLPPR